MVISVHKRNCWAFRTNFWGIIFFTLWFEINFCSSIKHSKRKNAFSRSVFIPKMILCHVSPSLSKWGLFGPIHEMLNHNLIRKDFGRTIWRSVHLWFYSFLFFFRKHFCVYFLLEPSSTLPSVLIQHVQPSVLGGGVYCRAFQRT